MKETYYINFGEYGVVEVNSNIYVKYQVMKNSEVFDIKTMYQEVIRLKKLYEK